MLTAGVAGAAADGGPAIAVNETANATGGDAQRTVTASASGSLQPAGTLTAPGGEWNGTPTAVDPAADNVTRLVSVAVDDYALYRIDPQTVDRFADGEAGSDVAALREAYDAGALAVGLTETYHVNARPLTANLTGGNDSVWFAAAANSDAVYLGLQAETVEVNGPYGTHGVAGHTFNVSLRDPERTNTTGTFLGTTEFADHEIDLLPEQFTTLASAPNQSVAGTTTAAPGTTYTAVVRGDGFREAQTVTVGSEQAFEAPGDHPAVADGDLVTVAVSDRDGTADRGHYRVGSRTTFDPTANTTTWTAPADWNTSRSVVDPRAENVTRTAVVAIGDQQLHRIDLAAFENVTDVGADATSDRVFVGLDTDALSFTSAGGQTTEPLSDGDRLNVSVTVTDPTGADASTAHLGTPTFRAHEVDLEPAKFRSVPRESDVRIAGATTAAPGSTYTVVARGVGYRETATVTAGADRTVDATFDFSSLAPGQQVTLTLTGLGERTSREYVVGEREITLPGAHGPAVDTDGDLQFEDLDGDGVATRGDVSFYFEHRDSAAVRDNPQFFDFDGVAGSVGDVIGLFEDLD